MITITESGGTITCAQIVAQLKGKPQKIRARLAESMDDQADLIADHWRADMSGAGFGLGPGWFGANNYRINPNRGGLIASPVAVNAESGIRVQKPEKLQRDIGTVGGHGGLGFAHFATAGAGSGKAAGVGSRKGPDIHAEMAWPRFLHEMERAVEEIAKWD